VHTEDGPSPSSGSSPGSYSMIMWHQCILMVIGQLQVGKWMGSQPVVGGPAGGHRGLYEDEILLIQRSSGGFGFWWCISPGFPWGSDGVRKPGLWRVNLWYLPLRHWEEPFHPTRKNSRCTDPNGSEWSSETSCFGPWVLVLIRWSSWVWTFCCLSHCTGYQL